MNNNRVVVLGILSVLCLSAIFGIANSAVASRLAWAVIDDRRVAPETVCRDGMRLGVSCVTGGCNGSPGAGLQTLADLNGLTSDNQTSFNAGTIPIELTLPDGTSISAETETITLDFDPILLDIGGTSTQWEMASHHTFMEVPWPRSVPANTEVLIDGKVAATVNECHLNGYVVQKGDRLIQIARDVYGNAARWRDIYDANRDMLSSPHRLEVGQVLMIP